MTKEQQQRIEEMTEWLPKQIQKLGEGAGWSLYKNDTSTANLLDGEYSIVNLDDSIEELVDYIAIELPHVKKFIVMAKTAKNSKNGKPFTILGTYQNSIGARVNGVQRMVASPAYEYDQQERITDLKIKNLEQKTKFNNKKAKRKWKNQIQEQKNLRKKAEDESKKSGVGKLLSNEHMVAQFGAIVGNLANAACYALTGVPLAAHMPPEAAGMGVLQQGARVAGTPDQEVADIDKMIADLEAEKQAKLAAKKKKIESDGEMQLDDDDNMALDAVQKLRQNGFENPGKYALAGCNMLIEKLKDPASKGMVEYMLKPYLAEVEKMIASK